jgi:hypothetical protein
MEVSNSPCLAEVLGELIQYLMSRHTLRQKVQTACHKYLPTYPADIRLAKQGIVELLFIGVGHSIKAVNATKLRIYSERTK